MGDRKSECRYGIELEGAFKGQLTLIVPTAALHSVEAIYSMLQEHGITNPLMKGYPSHIWLETLPGERWDWGKVFQIAERFNVTVQVTDGHAPPHILSDWPERVCVVWMLRPDQWEMLHTASYIKWASAPGHGIEAKLEKMEFNFAAYSKDEIWPTS